MRGIIVALLAAALLASHVSASAAATSCSGQYGTCFSMCEKYGYGRHRTDHPHPQTAAACHDHCIGWKTACLRTGCWRGDLIQICGLAKK
jgi:hypothetical protein